MARKVLVINEKQHSSKGSDRTTSGAQQVAQAAAPAPNGLTGAPRAAADRPAPSWPATGGSITVELDNRALESDHSQPVASWVWTQNGSSQPANGKQVPVDAADQPKCQQKQQQQPLEQQQFTLSPMRWPTLIGICVFGFCNGIANEYYSVLQVYVGVMGMSLSNYIYLSQMFFFLPFLVSFLAAGLIDKFGVRMTIFAGLLFGTIRNASRALLFFPHVALWTDLRLVYWMLQRIFMSITLSIYFCLPMRVAESWFAESERSLALSLQIVAPILGQAGASLVYPHYIVDVASSPLLAYTNLITALISIVVVTLTVQRSKPGEGAPSARNLVSVNELKEQAANKEKFSDKIKRIWSNSDYLIHVVTLNAFDPLIMVFQAILQDIFLSAGLSGVFCGQFLAVSTVMAALMQITCSVLLKTSSPPPASSRRSSRRDSVYGGGGSGEKAKGKVKKVYDPYRTRTCKIMLSLQCVLFIIFAHTLILHELYSCKWLIEAQWWLIMVTSIAYTLVRYSAAPYYNEQSAELICGTISEPLSGACQMTIISLIYNVVVVIFVRLRWEVSPSDVISDVNENEDAQVATTTNAKPQAIYQLSVLFVSAIALFMTLLYLIKFNPKRGAKQANQHQDIQLTTISSSVTTKSPTSSEDVREVKNVVSLSDGGECFCDQDD